MPRNWGYKNGGRPGKKASRGRVKFWQKHGFEMDLTVVGYERAAGVKLPWGGRKGIKPAKSRGSGK